MKFAGLALILLSLSTAVQADDNSTCLAAAGAYRTGVVVQGPTFQHGQSRNGVELSHTHVSLRADQDGQIYDVAMDNVFANGFDPQGSSIPAPLNTIAVNDRLELCGQLYSTGVGIHWVHTNCGATPTAAKPDGWVKQIAADGTVSANDESNTSYCSIFTH